MGALNEAVQSLFELTGNYCGKSLYPEREKASVNVTWRAPCGAPRLNVVERRACASCRPQGGAAGGDARARP